MDSLTVEQGSVPNSSDESQRVKFLCSFLGTILPRPQDGKLRYVGGETRIVSVPQDIKFEELMGKMRELYEDAVVLKYQQPDEDLDALVSVLNDDDVTNMMEECDKSGTGDGFTRLRLFLFAHSDQDASLHFGDGDERDNERRYVDALNSLNESPDFRKNGCDSLGVGSSFDDVNAAEQYFNQMNISNLTIPHLDSGQLQQTVGQRYNEMEAPWSPAYYSPRQPGSIEQRHVLEISTSPSSSRYQMPYGEFSEKAYDRMPEDYNRTSIMYEYQAPFTDNLTLVPPVPVANEMSGFPGNLLHGTSIHEGNSVCGNCRMTFQRNPNAEPSNAGNGYLHGPHSCADAPPNREGYLSDANLHPSYYYRDQNDPRSIYQDAPGHERGWVSPHQPNPWPEEHIRHLSISGRLPDGYIAENGIGMPLGPGNANDGHHLQSPYIIHDDQRYARPRVDYGHQVIQDQVVAPGPQAHMRPMEDRGIRYGSPLYTYQVPHGHISSQTICRNANTTLPGGPCYEASVSNQLVTGPIPMGFVQGAVEVSPRARTGLENQSPWAEPSQKPVGFDGSPMPEYSHVPGKFAPNGLESQHTCQVEPLPLVTPQVRPPSISQNYLPKSVPASLVDTAVGTKSLQIDENRAKEGVSEKSSEAEAKATFVIGSIDEDSDVATCLAPIKSNAPEANDENSGPLKVCETNPSILEKQSDDKLEFVPELIESAKEKTLENLKEVKDKALEGTDLDSEQKDATREDAQNHIDGADDNVDVQLDNDNGNDVRHLKIEPTKAEAEALERGLQTIRNEDLEEIRELGSGTYGAVFHGKWKGSDVAIKRIKASCFAGRPSERERLIADFWKEALTLSSLHHPNVVSFYGVVRDGPDGSLATVTEFMVNGSLKQFLQKKDRTIDRRKRLIIAMETAFGMEYLHAKNIVHFDLKCENLLVNMRDPHRPVCKIGDLGLSKVKQHTLVSGGIRGTLPWMAPELLSGKSNMVTEKIDVYSFGIVMWELLTGDEPYAEMHCASIIGGIVNNTLRPQIPTWCDPEWKSLMESCWGGDPAERPSFTEISQKLRTMAAAMNLK